MSYDSEVYSEGKNQARKEHVAVFGIQDRRHSELSWILLTELFWKGLPGV